MDILLYDGTQMTVGWMDDEKLDAEDPARRTKREIYSQSEVICATDTPS